MKKLIINIQPSLLFLAFLLSFSLIITFQNITSYSNVNNSQPLDQALKLFDNHFPDTVKMESDRVSLKDFVVRSVDNSTHLDIHYIDSNIETEQSSDNETVTRPVHGDKDESENDSTNDSEGTIGSPIISEEDVYYWENYLTNFFKHLTNILTEYKYTYSSNAETTQVTEITEIDIEIVIELEIIEMHLENIDASENLHTLIENIDNINIVELIELLQSNFNDPDIIDDLHHLLLLLFNDLFSLENDIGLVESVEDDFFIMSTDEQTLNVSNEIPMNFDLKKGQKIEIAYFSQMDATIITPLWIELILDVEKNTGIVKDFNDNWFRMINSDGQKSDVNYSNLDLNFDLAIGQKVEVLSHMHDVKIMVYPLRFTALDVELILDVEKNTGVIKSFNDNWFRMVNSDNRKFDVNYSDLELNFDLAVGQKVEVLSHIHDVKIMVYPERLEALNVELIADLIEESEENTNSIIALFITLFTMFIALIANMFSTIIQVLFG